ncbi:MAG: SPOR domain-containing protein [Nitrospinota bacterium]|nr:SPOR domain-containing protein [Nitrospinota bacterium]
MTDINAHKCSFLGLFALAASVGFLATAGDARAFSLGKIRVTGAYEDSFKAEIPVRTDGQKGLVAYIGSQDDYERIDEERPAFLDRFKVVVADHPLHPGQKLIYISCDEPIYQPSFNLLVIARMGGGMIMENYFLALDLQKNLQLSLPTPKKEREAAPATLEDKEELSKVAEMMRALRPGQEAALPKESSKESPTTTVNNSSLLDQIRAEEEREVAKARGMAIAKAPTSANASASARIPAQVATPATTRVSPPEAMASPLPAVASQPEGESPVVLAAMDPNESVYVVLSVEEQAALLAQPEEPAAAQPIQVAEAPTPAPVSTRNPAPDQPRVLAHGIEGSRFVARPMELEQIKIVMVEPGQKPKVVREAMALTEPAPQAGQLAAAPPVAPPATRKGKNGFASRVFASPAQPSAGRARGDNGAGAYVVARGDSLFKIASSLDLVGAGADQRKAVVALWMENREKFINGNMNGINRGVPLDYSNVKSRMATLSQVEANRVIRDQWLEWKGGKAVPPAQRKPVTRVAVAMEKVAKPVTPPANKQATTQTRKPVPAPVAGPSSGHKPYVVHVASFKSREHSSEYVRLLRSKGFNAFEIISEVPGKGTWRRVVVDRMGQLREAKALGKTLQENAISDYTQVLKLPFAISIGGPVAENEARSMLKRFEGKGLAPYALRDPKDGGYTILVGAYATSNVAKQDLPMLTGLDLQPKIVQP